jgi:rRNA maturation RNase YbeY
MPIRFFQEGVNFSLIHKTILKKWMISSAAEEGFKMKSLTFIFMDDKQLLNLNRRFLKHDEFTDILTFDLKTQNQKVIDGEIYISIERVKENAAVYSTTFSEELHRVMIHGLLHLCGYRDKTASQKNEMRNREDYYLGKLNRILKRK